jgi:predicted ABC-type ATPase
MEDTDKPSPFLLVIGGPNGSGKTTITDRFRAAGIDLGHYINADEITLEVLKNNTFPSEKQTHSANRKAQGIADLRRQESLKKGESLSFETVMSHPSKIEFMYQAKEKGFEVSLYFIGTLPQVCLFMY